MSFVVTKLVDHAIIPTRAHDSDAGMDLSSSEDVTILAGSQAFVATGLAISIPYDCYARVAPRSGLAAKHSIHVMAGVIDSGYKGEVKVILFNLGKKDFEIKKGDRIAQIVFEKIYTPAVLEEVSKEEYNYKYNNTTRGTDGFGSTGV